MSYPGLPIMKQLLVLAAFIMLVGLAKGEDKTRYFTDGNKLLQICKVDYSTAIAQVEFHDIGNCAGYVAASVDALSMLMKLDGQECIFKTDLHVALGQYVDVVKLYLINHPTNRHFPAIELIMTALHEAFPCK